MWPFKKKHREPEDPCEMKDHTISSLLGLLEDKEKTIATIEKQIAAVRVGSVEDAKMLCKINNNIDKMNRLKRTCVRELENLRSHYVNEKAPIIKELVDRIKIDDIWIRVGDKAIAKWRWNDLLIAPWRNDIEAVEFVPMEEARRVSAQREEHKINNWDPSRINERLWWQIDHPEVKHYVLPMESRR